MIIKKFFDIELEIDVLPDHYRESIDLDKSFYKIEEIKSKDTKNEKIKIIIE